MIEKLWDKFWSAGISNPITAIEQITYLLFMKRLDDLDKQKMQQSQLHSFPYISKFQGNFVIPKTDIVIEKKELRWSYFKELPPEDMLFHVQTKVFPFLKELNGDDSGFTMYMKNAVFTIAKPVLLAEAISIIDEVFTEMEKDASVKGHSFQDIQGDVYEVLLNEIASAGKNGQFRTPRHIIKLVADLVSPQLGDRIADPACGTGGFLLGAYQYILTQLDKNKENLLSDEDGFIRTSKHSHISKEIRQKLETNIIGYDIDLTMVRLGIMNLIMHGIDNPSIDYKDTLSKDYHDLNEYDVVMANPPFTGSIDITDIHDDLNLNTTKTELLFIERIFHMLKPGGTAGIIVPQGVLFSRSKANVEIRRKLVEESQLQAVITMPSGVFQPYAGVSTAILIFTKAKETKKVWFYNMESDGYSLDNRREKLKEKGDLQEIKEFFKNRANIDSDRGGKHFFVSKGEVIIDGVYDLSFAKYKKEIFEDVKYENSKEILKRINKIESDIQQELKLFGGYFID